MAREVLIDHDTDEYYDDDDGGRIDIADLDHPIAEMLEDDNVYKILGMSPAISNAEAQGHAYMFLGELWNSCLETDDDVDYKGLYIQILETLFIKFYEDLNFILKLLAPATLSSFFKTSPYPQKIALEKLAFNTLYPVETSDYGYPADVPPHKNDEAPMGYLHSGDSAFRGSWDSEHDAMASLMDQVPESWKPALKAYLERTAEYLYGGQPAHEPIDQCT
jgi:hypothetical protein